jgi:hypothetical protein
MNAAHFLLTIHFWRDKLTNMVVSKLIRSLFARNPSN